MTHQHTEDESPIVEETPAVTLRDAFAESAVAPTFACGHPDMPPFSYYSRPSSPTEMCGICVEIGPTQLFGEPLPDPEAVLAAMRANDDRKAGRE